MAIETTTAELETNAGPAPDRKPKEKGDGTYKDATGQ